MYIDAIRAHVLSLLKLLVFRYLHILYPKKDLITRRGELRNFKHFKKTSSKIPIKTSKGQTFFAFSDLYVWTENMGLAIGNQNYTVSKSKAKLDEIK